MMRLAFIALGALLATPAHAQDASGFHGVWNCQMRHEQLDTSGNVEAGFARNISIEISPDRSFKAHGYTPGLYDTDHFTIQGQWALAADGVLFARGPEVKRNAPASSPAAEFYLIASLVSRTELAYAADTGALRTHTQCIRS